MSTSDSSHSDSSDKPSRDASGQSETETRTTESTQTQHLTTEEEKVIRMRRGLAEDGDHDLEFGVGADEATSEKLAQLEAFLVEAFSERESGERYLDDAEYGEVDIDESEDTAESDNDTKQKIIDELSDD